MSMQIVHPSRSKLRDWLSALVPSDKVTVHVESCERCASRLIDLADQEATERDQLPDDASLARAVTAEWVPPADLAERVIRTIDERQRNERDLTVMLGLFGIATETASLMLAPEPTRPQRTAHPSADGRRDIAAIEPPTPDNEGDNE